jgi:hypothetical protein
MATTHGKDGVLKNGSNTPAEIVDFSYDEMVDVVDDGAKGDTYKTHLQGRKSWNGSATANFDSTDTAGQVALAVGASVTLNLYPTGAGVSAAYKTGTATVTKRSVAVPLDNKVSIQFTFEGNGTLTDATVGA